MTLKSELRLNKQSGFLISYSIFRLIASFRHSAAKNLRFIDISVYRYATIIQIFIIQLMFYHIKNVERERQDEMKMRQVMKNF